MNRSVMFSIMMGLYLAAFTVVRGSETSFPLAIAPFHAQTANNLQQETATYLNKPIIRKIELGDGAHIELILIPAGEFDMGSAYPEQSRANDEGPVHRITISKPFYIGRYEITQAQWKAVMGYSLSHLKDPNLPADGIDWSKAVDFCKRLSERQFEIFRLPTEAEWEYACRAGTVTAYSFGNDPTSLTQYAWCNSNSNHKTHLVGQKKPNAFGLYDMHGNVWEWCSDFYDDYLVDSTVDPSGPPDGSCRILRGGSWFCTPGPCRSANRGWNTPETRDDDVGFRIVLECSQ